MYSSDEEQQQKEITEEYIVPSDAYEYIFYHKKCADGVRSAQILKGIFTAAKCIGVHSAGPFTFDGIDDDKISEISIICVDVVFKPEQLNQFLRFKHVKIIDHHAGNKEFLESCQEIPTFEITFDESRAACQIVEDLFCGERTIITDCIGYRDLFRANEFPNTNEVCASLYLESETYFVEKTLNARRLKSTPECSVPRHIRHGTQILKLQKFLVYEDVKTAEQCSLETPVGTFKIWTVFTQRNTNEVCNYLCHIPLCDGTMPDFSVAYIFNCKNGMWEFSLRSINTDLVPISQSMGGGGHTLAAKFTDRKISFLQILSGSVKPPKPDDYEDTVNGYNDLIKKESEHSGIVNEWFTQQNNFAIYGHHRIGLVCIYNRPELPFLLEIEKHHRKSGNLLHQVIGYTCSIKNRSIIKTRVNFDKSRKYTISTSNMSIGMIRDLYGINE